jgi:hypothetical protein
MFHPRILRHYTYRVTDCQSRPIDALADVAQYESIPVRSLASFLCTIGAVGAQRLTLI